MGILLNAVAHGIEAKVCFQRDRSLTSAVFFFPAWSPDSRKVVLPLTLLVTRPLCLLIKSVASSRHIDSSTPVMTNVLPIKHSGWPLGSSCAQ